MSLGEYIGAGSGTTKLLLHLNGNSTDSSGNGNSGTDTNITWVDGKFGKCASFNGSSSYITIPYSSSLDLGTGGFTIIHWFKTTQTTPGQLIHRQENSGSHLQIIFTAINETTGKLSFQIRGSENTSYDLNSATSYNDGNWHCYIAVSTGSGGNMNIYVDGKLDATRSIGATTINFGASTVLTVGSVYQSWVPYRAWYYNGLLDETIIDGDWTPQQVAKYYTMTKGRFGII